MDTGNFSALSPCNIKKTKFNYPFLPAGLQPVSASSGKLTH